MTSKEIRDSEEARRYVLQSFLLSRDGILTAGRVTTALQCALEIVCDGTPLPLLGFVADVGHVVSRTLYGTEIGSLPEVNGLDASDARRYEDYVLGKLYADVSFERAADGVLRFKERDRHRAMAYLINRIRVRSGFEGVMMTPAVIKSLLHTPPGKVLDEAWDLVARDGLSTAVIADWRTLVDAFRSTGELLGPGDILEIESGTALAEFRQRVALRQVLSVAENFRGELPKRRPRSLSRAFDVATHLREEDQYPVGGFSSISNRGTIESLVRSELAYMEDDSRPDLFDIKFARNELLYYSRDENQLVRRRLYFVFVFCPDLVAARIKDAGLPSQRIVMLLAALLVITQQLLEWLAQDAIEFTFLFINKECEFPLKDEVALLETFFHDQISSGLVSLEEIDFDDVESHCEQLSGRGLCHVLMMAVENGTAPDLFSTASLLQLDTSVPRIHWNGGEILSAVEPGVAGWQQQLNTLLRLWI